MDRDPADSSKDTRFFFNKTKYAIRGGRSTSTSPWDDAQVGSGSVAFGDGPLASGLGAVALGAAAKAQGDRSVAIGSNSTAVGADSNAIGAASGTAGTRSTAVGYNAVSADASGAFGNFAQTVTTNSTAVGQKAKTRTKGAVSLGFDLSNSFRHFLAASVISTTSAASIIAWGSGVNITTAAANVYTILAKSIHVFTYRATARRTDVGGTECAAWRGEGVITRDATGNCRFVGTPTQTQIAVDPAASTWILDASLQATSNYFMFQSTGEDGKTIQWNLQIEIMESTW
jgi:hypothetical protein